jgi:hypothetical protein
MNALEIRLSTLGILLSLFSCVTHAQMTAKKIAVGSGNLCVTEGAVENSSGDRLTVDAPKMRAYVNAWTSQAIEAQVHLSWTHSRRNETRFGRNTPSVRPETPRAERLQPGVRHVAHRARVEESWSPSKEIPTRPEAPSAETAATRTSSLAGRLRYPPCDPGDTHTLGAELDEDELHVFVDNRVVWEGGLGPEAQELQGPVGIRSDNVRLAFDLKAGAMAGMHPDVENEKKNAQVEDPYGRGQALQQDWHRQNQAGPDEDAAHPYFEVAKVKRKLGRTLLVSDGDYKKVARMIPYA